MRICSCSTTTTVIITSLLLRFRVRGWSVTWRAWSRFAIYTLLMIALWLWLWLLLQLLSSPSLLQRRQRTRWYRVCTKSCTSLLHQLFCEIFVLLCWIKRGRKWWKCSRQADLFTCLDGSSNVIFLFSVDHVSVFTAWTRGCTLLLVLFSLNSFHFC